VRLDHGLPVAHHELVGLLVDLQELQGEAAADDGLRGELAGEVGTGEERAETLHDYDRPAPVHGDYLRLEYLVVILEGRDGVPRLAVEDPPEGDLELPVGVLLADYLDVVGRTEGDETIDGGLFTSGEAGFLNGEESRSLRADVQEATVAAGVG